MFERYTEKARRVIFFARYEASQFGSPEIDTEHLMLGLFREDHGLRKLGPELPLESIRKRIEAAQQQEKISTSVDLPLSHECKRVLALAAEEADKLAHPHIGTAHLLLGLMEQPCYAGSLLREYGWEVDALRPAAASQAATDEPPHRAQAWKMHAEAFHGLYGMFCSHPEAALLYRLASAEAAKMGSPYIETKHLLSTVLERCGETFLGASAAAIRELIKPEPPRREKVSTGAPQPTNESLRAFSYAIEEAALQGDKEVGPGHLALGLLREESCEAAEILRANGLSLDKVRRVITETHGAASSGSGES